MQLKRHIVVISSALFAAAMMSMISGCFYSGRDYEHDRGHDYYHDYHYDHDHYRDRDQSMRSGSEVNYQRLSLAMAAAVR